MSQLYCIGHVWMNEILSEDDSNEAALDCLLFLAVPLQVASPVNKVL